MTKKRINFFIFLLLIFFSLFVLQFLLPNKDVLEIDFFDVGQGDSILIQSPYGQNILIDGGPDNKVIQELSKNLAWNNRKIDLLILTHPHADHVTGLIDVLKRYKVEKILYSGKNHTSDVYLNWLKLVKQKNIPLEIVKQKEKIILAKDLFLQILYPNRDLVDDRETSLNNSSIVAQLVFNKKKFLFMGDAESEVEDIVMKNNDVSSDVLKVGHHGSKTGSDLFIKTVKPKIAVIEVGQDNPFGHPHQQTLDSLAAVGAKIYRTDKDRTIKLISDGLDIVVK